MSDYYTVTEKIKKMPGGYLVYVRWPLGPTPCGYGPVICSTWDEVVKLLTKAANENEVKII